MKKAFKSLLVTASLFLSIAVFAQKTKIKTETFKVSGNCGMCKKHIEGAVAKAPGVTKAVWNKDTQKMSIVYDPSKITMEAIEKRIAAVGYDTQNFKADDKAYKALDECCQYDRNATPPTREVVTQ